MRRIQSSFRIGEVRPNCPSHRDGVDGGVRVDFCGLCDSVEHWVAVQHVTHLLGLDTLDLPPHESILLLTQVHSLHVLPGIRRFKCTLKCARPLEVRSTYLVDKGLTVHPLTEYEAALKRHSAVARPQFAIPHSVECSLHFPHLLVIVVVFYSLKTDRQVTMKRSSKKP
jgi:hypothetical protein